MDWMKLFTLLVAVATIQVTAEGPKKKIRIHLPQKVKHIHHHKKIYITNHPASSQYAPAYMPSAEGAVAVPTNVGLPAVASIVPFNSVDLYEESQTRMPGVSPAASKLLPLYRARGYYGPTPAEVEEQEYDLAPPPESTEHSYIPTAFSQSSAAGPISNYPPKRVKVLKVNEPPRKKSAKKPKPKRVKVVRAKPQPEEEHPVTNYHEQFYSDLDGSGTIRKIRKPQRVEKIIDGDTEHIHTYSEEHIHKLVFDGGSKFPGALGADQLVSMSHSLAPIKNHHSLLAVSDSLTGYGAVSPFGGASNLEYASYNPRDVTHDHIFHDHGEIPSDLDVTKDSLTFPPRVSYNSQGIKIGPKGIKSKYSTKHPKPTKPAIVPDLSYYESIYSPNKLRSVQRPVASTSHFDSLDDDSIDNYRPIPSFKYKDKGNIQTPLYFGAAKQDYRLQQASVPEPFSVSSTVVHDYKPKHYSSYGSSGITKYKDPLINFKDTYSNNFEYDTYASSSNVYTSEDKQDTQPNPPFQHGKKGKKKSISTQNISFGGSDHQTTVDHQEDAEISEINNVNQLSSVDSVTSTAYTIRESSPAHAYYAEMAIKALHNDQGQIAQASDNNFQFIEAPTTSTTSYPSSQATTIASEIDYYEVQNSNPATTEKPNHVSESNQRLRSKEVTPRVNSDRETKARYTVLEVHSTQDQDVGRLASPTVLVHGSRLHKHPQVSSVVGNLKYGDRI